MDRLPLLPGYVFNDPTENQFHVPHTLNYKNGHAIPISRPKLGIGRKPLDADSVEYLDLDKWCWDPSFTYGERPAELTKSKEPQYAEFAGKTLAFKAFSIEARQGPLGEEDRVQHVMLYYHLEDDTMSVIEPQIPNSGFMQGKIIRRHRIPRVNEDDEELFWHWKNLNVGYDVWLYGNNYHLTSCDAYTREFLTSQGIEVGDDEQIPEDPYTALQKLKALRRFQAEQDAEKQKETEAGTALDKLGRFLLYDRKVLRFFAVQQEPETVSDATAENEAHRRFRVLLYLSDGSLEVRPEYDLNDGYYHFPKLVARRPLPIRNMPVDLPSWSAKDAECIEPEHLRVGDTIDVLGRKLLLYDCDTFTRDYYAQRLGRPQPEAVNVETTLTRAQPVTQIPPHTGMGSPEDTLQSCIYLMPRPPRFKPCVPPLLEEMEKSERRLRYALKLDTARPADQNRRFILIFEPLRGFCTINELPGRNTGIQSGRFLGPIKLKKPVRPGELPQPIQPEYYGPQDFGIGAVIVASGQRFVVINADLYVLRWLSARRGHFPPELEQQLREHLHKQGVITEDND